MGVSSMAFFLLLWVVLLFQLSLFSSASALTNAMEKEERAEAVLNVKVQPFLDIIPNKKLSMSRGPLGIFDLLSSSTQFQQFSLHDSHPTSNGKRKETNNGSRNKRFLIAAICTSGAALLVCFMGLLWVACGKLKLHKKLKLACRTKNRSRTQIGGSTELDFLYLETMGWDLGQNSKSSKPTSEISNPVFVVKHECQSNDWSCILSEEKLPVHDEVELDSDHDKPLGINSPDADDVTTAGDHSSDDETFVSLGDDSHVSTASESANSLPDSFKTGLPDAKSTYLPPPPPPPPLPPPRRSFLSTSASSSLPKRLTSQPSDCSSVPKKLSSTCRPLPHKPHNEADEQGICINKQPSSLPHQVSPENEEASLPKLRPLHWDKVKATPDRGMVWDKIRPNSFEFDEEMIESLFGYKHQSSMKMEESTSKSSSLDKRVLDPKRLQNITILLKAVNSTPQQVCEALIRGNGLSQAQLEALSRMAPTAEEEAKLTRCDGSVNELVAAEKFIKALLGIPSAFLRVEAMLFRETFEDEVVHLRNSFSMLEEACKELRSSRLFLKLLQAVLKTGNRMNNGTIRGGARAFRLDALLKLADIKGTDGKTTLLHFVVQEIIRSEGIQISDSQKCTSSPLKGNASKTMEEREEDYKRTGLELISGLSTEMHNVKKTATVDMELLASSVSNLAEGIAKVKGLINDELVTNDGQNERFVATMKAFSGYAARALKELRDDERRVSVSLGEVTEYFHGDNVCKVEEPLRIFVIVRDFLGMLEQVCKEIRSSRYTSGPNMMSPFR